MGKNTVLEVKVVNMEKRKFPVKHYVYILEVSWSEGTTTTVYRRYSDFFEFQCELLERFPEEAGSRDPAMRMIPFLPGKKLLGRSQTRAVAEKRREKLNDYCRSLIRLPPTISDDQFVIDFFNVRPEDLAPSDEKPSSNKKGAEEIQEISGPLVLERFVAMADYEKQKKNECSLEAGQTVEVIDKNSNGWWFVNVDDFNEGWVPATYLEPIYGGDEVGCQVLEPGNEEVHISMSAYSPQNEDEIAFEKGVLLEVFEKNLDGWWKVRYKGQEGFAPAAYLQRYHGAVINLEVTTGAQVVSNINDAISSNGAKSESWKPADSARVPTPKSSTWKNSEPTSPSWKPPEASRTPTPKSSTWKNSEPISPKLDEWKPPEASRVPSPKLPTKPKPFDAPRSTSPKNSELAAVTSPKPVSPKPEVQKFAPTWHSMQHHSNYIDKEPIYAPTPRIFPGKKKKPPPPVLKPKPSTTSPTTSPVDDFSQYDLPQPVYECIDQPKEQIYLTIGDFKPTNMEDGLSFTSGVLVSVITKNATGWWFVDLDGVEGWVPSSYLESTTSNKTISPVSNEPAPPLPVRNTVSVPPPKKELLKPFEKPTRPVLSPAPKKKTLPKTDHSSVTRVKTVALGTSSNRTMTSLRRSQSTESLDRDTQRKPIVRRTKSPPAIHVATTSNGWKQKPVPVKPLKSPLPVVRNMKPASKTVTMSPRTARLSKGQISDPLPHKSPPAANRHTSVSKTISLQSLNSKGPALKSGTMHTSISTNSLLAPENNSRTTSIGTRPAKPAPPTASPAIIRKNVSYDTYRGPPKKTGTETIKNPGASRRSSETTKYPQRGGDTASRPPNVHRGSEPNVRRGGSEESTDTGPHHLSELESKLRLRTKTTDNDKPKKAPPPQRPKAPPPQRSKAPPSRPKEPPKRPDPPKPGPAGVKRPPPPKPYAAPSVKKATTSYVVVGDYTGEKDSCLTLSEGDWVDVIERNDDGWWFVEIDGSQGWAPSSFLEEKQKTATDTKPSRPSRPKMPVPYKPEARNVPTIPSRPRPPPTKTPSDEQAPSDSTSDNNTATTPRPKPRTRVHKSSVTNGFARATSAYTVPAYEDNGMELVQGRLYEVKERRDTGWWLVRDGDSEGWAPASHLEAI